MTIRSKVLLSTALIAAMSTSAWAGDHSHHTDKAMSQKENIVSTAVNAGQFKTLAAALQAADLVNTLQGEGPFTVFAPTDEAFAKLPKGTVEALLKDKKALQAILLYHVVSGKVSASDVSKIKTAKTVSGKSVSIKTNDQGVFINTAKVVKADIMTSNGIIHVIDEVILPPQ